MLPGTDEKELLQRLACGDMAALGALYDRHARAVYHLLLVRGLTEAEAQDLLQEAFLALAERGRKLRGVQSAAAYLLGIARHLAARQLRRPDRQQPLPVPDSVESGQNFERPLEIQQMLRRLPPEQAEVLILKVWHDLTFAEIAAVLQIPANTAASRYRYAVEKMRGLWGDE